MPKYLEACLSPLGSYTEMLDKRGQVMGRNWPGGDGHPEQGGVVVLLLGWPWGWQKVLPLEQQLLQASSFHSVTP